MRGFFLYLLFLTFIPALCACGEDKAPAGIVATVNGEPIALHSVQSLIDSRTAAMGIPPRPSIEEMRKNYERALNTLIAHALVRQELAARGLAIGPVEVDEAIEEIRKDYGEDSLDGFLADSSIREADWRQQMLDHLALETFKNEILFPGIEVSLDEVRDYYKTHKKEFRLPENLRVCLLAADSGEAISAWCQSMDPAKNFPGLIAQCMDMKAEEIPQEWQKDLRKMKAGSCLPAREENGEWHSLGLLGRGKGGTLGLAESYALVEKILMEGKRREAFDSWLKKKLAASKILVNPELNYGLEENGEKEESAAEVENSNSQ